MTSVVRVSEPTSFKIEIAEERIELLQKKLALATLPDELEDAGWDYGVPLSEVKRLLARWNNGYDWKKYEKDLNDKLPQFQTDIDVDGFGILKIHFVHRRSEVQSAIPLLFVHGWPGGFFEVQKILPLLTQKARVSQASMSSPTVFQDLVSLRRLKERDLPSINTPRFVTPLQNDSQRAHNLLIRNYHKPQVGNKLMMSLGYSEYVTQGGDWGSNITHRIASIYGGKHSKAWHTNNPQPEDPSLLEHPPTFFAHPWLYLSNLFTTHTTAEREHLKRKEWLFREGRGYYAEQATQPQTLGYSLADSPIGLLAWIYEKLVNWTDNYPWDDDEVLNWVSVYWFSTAGPSASMRIYYENEHEKGEVTLKSPTIPHGASFFPKELIGMPRSWTRTKYRVFESEQEAGGHFPAYEQPERLVEDIRKMFGNGGPAFGVVKDETGY